MEYKLKMCYTFSVIIKRKILQEDKTTKEKFLAKIVPQKGMIKKIAKNKTVFVCNECGYESGKWLGKCPACGSWNTFFEQKIVESKNSSLKAEKGTNNVPQKLNSYEAKETIRTSTGFDELDRVLGGGLVKGSLILLGGEPGIGKSTLILQLCDKVKGEGQVLYVSGEESAEQIKLRADRLRNK